MKTRVAVGIDPGATHTGIVLRVNGEFHGGWIVDRDRCDPIVPLLDHLNEILETIDIAAARGLAIGNTTPEVLIAVEDLISHETHPSLRRKTTAPLIATGAVLAVVVVSYPAAVRVPPGGNGSGPLEAYPEALRPTRGAGKGHDKLRHCRSAWDVAVAGERLARHGAATA